MPLSFFDFQSLRGLAMAKRGGGKWGKEFLFSIQVSFRALGLVWLTENCSVEQWTRESLGHLNV